jgi:hypothetical protein
MGTFNSTARFDGDPEELLALLTEIEEISRWSPVPFQLAGGERRLRAGDEVFVEGGLLGRNVRFRVLVDQADERGISLRASGAFEIDVDYVIDPAASRVSARVETRGGRTFGRVLVSAANAMLSAGALERVLGRLVREARETRGAARCAIA